MTARPGVSVIIVNWNGAEHLRICLPSLLSQSLSPLEIIVVDNCSSDCSSEVAKSAGVRWLALEKNLGLAPALNRGAALAKGDLLLFVNNDMRFHPEFIAKLVAPLERDDQTFATDGMQFNWDGSSRVHLAARLTKVSTLQNGSSEVLPGLYFYQQERAENTPVFMASAACMMVRKRFFERLGGFDNRLPLGYEDIEICWRAWVHDLKTLYVPGAICWHRVGSSIRSLEAARFAFRGILKGRLLLAAKLLPARYVVRVWLVSVAGLAKDIGLLRWKFAVDRVRVLFQMAGLLRQLHQEKRNLFRNRTTSRKLLEFLLQLAESRRWPGASRK